MHKGTVLMSLDIVNQTHDVRSISAVRLEDRGKHNLRTPLQNFPEETAL